MRIVFIGPPGAGKGTQAERIVDKYSMAHLSTGDMLRAARDAQSEVGKAAEEYMSRGALVPDEVIMGIVAERLQADDCAQGFLLDGIPRTIVQAEQLERVLEEQEKPLDGVLELRVPDEPLFDRLAGRGRADDTPEVIRQRLVAYHEQTEPLLTFYEGRGLLRTVDGLGTIDEVFARVVVAMDGMEK